MHQVEYYRHLVRALGFANGPPAPHRADTRAPRRWGRALQQAGWDGRTPLVALAPGAAFGSCETLAAAGVCRSGRRTRRRRDRRRACRRSRRPGHRVRRVRQLPAARRSSISSAAPTPDARRRPGNCRALVANDSGALHLAAALGVSVTAVFGPTDERLTAPRRRDASPEPRARVAVLTHPVWCRPCCCASARSITRACRESARRVCWTRRGGCCDQPWPPGARSFSIATAPSSKKSDTSIAPSVSSSIRGRSTPSAPSIAPGCAVVMVTNQSGVARGFFREAVVDEVHRHMAAMLAEGGAHIDAYYYCPHHPDGKVAEYARPATAGSRAVVSSTAPCTSSASIPPVPLSSATAGSMSRSAARRAPGRPGQDRLRRRRKSRSGRTIWPPTPSWTT